MLDRRNCNDIELYLFSSEMKAIIKLIELNRNNMYEDEYRWLFKPIKERLEATLSEHQKEVNKRLAI